MTARVPPLFNSHALKLIARGFTEIVAFEEKILVDAQSPTELYKVLHVVAGKEAAARSILPTATSYHWYRLQLTCFLQIESSKFFIITAK